MTNEEKAIELAENISPYDIGGDNAAHYAAKDAALDAMEWKDEQFEERCKHFLNHTYFGEYYNRQGILDVTKLFDDLINFIKQEE